MKSTGIINSVKSTFNKVKFTAIQKSPEILIILGIGGVIAGGVMACVATTKAVKVAEKTKENIKKIHERIEDESHEDYTEKEGTKDLAVVYGKTALEFAKLYGPSVVISTLSIVSIVSSNNILRKRNVALATAYAAVDKSFKEYRNRVAAKIGSELEKKLWYNEPDESSDEQQASDENCTTDATASASTNVGQSPSPFAKFFDESNVWWEKNSDHNLNWLLVRQNIANDRLKANGYLFLNEVYKMLGIDETVAGQSFGWIYDPDNPDHTGDNYVDFGIYDGTDPAKISFVNGQERSILLDFNVDGYILSPEKLGKCGVAKV